MTTAFSSMRRAVGEAVYCEVCRIATKYPGLVTERRRRCPRCERLACRDCFTKGEQICVDCQLGKRPVTPTEDTTGELAPDAVQSLTPDTEKDHD